MTSRQYVAVQFDEAPGARRYTYHNDGPPVEVGDVVEVERQGKPVRVRVAALPTTPPSFATRGILLPPDDDASGERAKINTPGEDTAVAHAQETPPPPPAGIGHNQPDSPVDEAAFAELERRARDQADAAGAWTEAGEITDEVQSGKLTDLLDQCSKLVREIENQRKADKAPWREKVEAVDQRYKTLTEPLNRTIARVKKLLTAWASRKKAEEQEAQRREIEARQKAEAEARRKAEEAAARNDDFGAAEAESAAEAERKAREAAERRQVKGQAHSLTGGGRTRGLRTVRKAKLTNLRRAFMGLHERHAAELTEVLERLANQELRAAKGAEVDLPGFEITTEESI